MPATKNALFPHATLTIPVIFIIKKSLKQCIREELKIVFSYEKTGALTKLIEVNAKIQQNNKNVVKTDIKRLFLSKLL